MQKPRKKQERISLQELDSVMLKITEINTSTVTPRVLKSPKNLSIQFSEAKL